MGFTVIVPPSANDRIEFLNQFLCLYRCLASGPFPNLLLEVSDRFLTRIGIQTALTTPLRILFGDNFSGSAPSFDLVAKKFKPLPNMDNTGLLGYEVPLPASPRIFLAAG